MYPSTQVGKRPPHHCSTRHFQLTDSTRRLKPVHTVETLLDLRTTGPVSDLDATYPESELWIAWARCWINSPHSTSSPVSVREQHTSSWTLAQQA